MQSNRCSYAPCRSPEVGAAYLTDEQIDRLSDPFDFLDPATGSEIRKLARAIESLMRAAQREAFALGAAQGQQEPVDANIQIAEALRAHHSLPAGSPKRYPLVGEIVEVDGSIGVCTEYHKGWCYVRDLNDNWLDFISDEARHGPCGKSWRIVEDMQAAQPAAPMTPISNLDMQCRSCGKPAVSINRVFPSCSCGGQTFEGSFRPAAPVVAGEPRKEPCERCGGKGFLLPAGQDMQYRQGCTTCGETGSKRTAERQAKPAPAGMELYHRAREATYREDLKNAKLLPVNKQAELNSARHAAIRKVLRHHGLTVHGDAVVEADLIAAMLAAAPQQSKEPKCSD